MRSARFALVLSLGIAVLSALAPPSSAQSVAKVVIAAPAKAGDSTDHLDLLRGTSERVLARALDSLGRPIDRRITYWSSNSAVASVSSEGVVTAKARGYAKVLVAASTRRSSLQVCVTNEPYHALQEPDINGVQLLPAKFTLGAGATRQAMLDLTLRTRDVDTSAVPPASCIHWSLGVGPLMPTLDTSVIKLRAGGRVWLNPGKVAQFYPSASLGPKLATSAMLHFDKRKVVSMQQIALLLDRNPGGDFTLFRP